MEKRYQPQNFEEQIYQLWEKNNSFTPKVDPTKLPFTIIMPPPNANAPLHIGHAMFVALEDLMIRFQRMQGVPSLWLPGADHAGILTQVVFERGLKKQGKTRFDLGRKNFYDECYKFTQNNKKIMYDQLKKLGASCDWTREKFTLDTKISSVVLRTFINLYKDGLAYRGDRLINWCSRCMTALADLEVEYKEEEANLWFIKYPLHKDPKKFIVVATTRPETMLGDTALAVNPRDSRYQKLIGQKVVLPIAERILPIISDQVVDQKFGTGVVKVTPAHDFNDYALGQKHKLETISVIGFDNKMTKKAGIKFVGLPVLEARNKVLSCLDMKKLLSETKTFRHQVPHCERCKTIIEPLISKQWFVNTSLKFKVKSAKLKKLLGVSKASLKELGILAVKKNLIRILPKRFVKNYLNWMENLHDWCVSRQLWWGHQLPIWYCGTKGLSELQKQMNLNLTQKLKVKSQKSKSGCGEIIVSLKKPPKCPKCGSYNLIQDPDTFDTWFSSSQWPYATLGFTESCNRKQKAESRKPNDFDYFYPTTVMETGYEILYLWVARMIFIGLYQTGSVPFKNIYLHGLVRDAFGQKMSKSKGNVINPLEVIKNYGADALRMALIVGTGPGNDLTVTEEKIKGYRNFCNKIWNIGRFITLSLDASKSKIPWYKKSLPGLTQDDKNIVLFLNKLIKSVTLDLANFRFSPALEAIYQFLWHELADNYLEKVKQRVRDNDLVALSILRFVFYQSLKLLHPFAPFITETIWQGFPKPDKTLLIHACWPKAD